MMPGDPLNEPELLRARLDEILGIEPQLDEGSVIEPDLDLDVPPEPASTPDRLCREFQHTTTPFIVTTAQKGSRR
ncbi:hypothetical protein ACIBCD_33780 [Nocardia brasiliensis]|uniref:hypothetical protein n=1 Tax=Nocardia brasiliensis TaxID=37326 RepID=UPI00378F3FD1